MGQVISNHVLAGRILCQLKCFIYAIGGLDSDELQYKVNGAIDCCTTHLR